MAIVILETRIDSGSMTGVPDTRGVTLWISDGTDSYITQVGNLPLAGALLPGLEANEENIWLDAVSGGQLATETETEIASAILWYLSAPGTKSAIFDKTVAQEVTDITALIAASFPSASAAVKAGWLQLLMSSLLDTRVNAHDRELV